MIQPNDVPLAMMRIVLTGAGGPASLAAIREALPEPHAGEIRVRVAAAGVAFAARVVIRAQRAGAACGTG